MAIHTPVVPRRNIHGLLVSLETEPKARAPPHCCLHKREREREREREFLIITEIVTRGKF